MSIESNPTYTSRASISEERAIERVKEMLKDFYILFGKEYILDESNIRIIEIWISFTKDFCDSYFNQCKKECIRKCKTMPAIADFFEDYNNYVPLRYYSEEPAWDKRYEDYKDFKKRYESFCKKNGKSFF